MNKKMKIAAVSIGLVAVIIGGFLTFINFDRNEIIDTPQVEVGNGENNTNTEKENDFNIIEDLGIDDSKIEELEEVQENGGSAAENTGIEASQESIYKLVKSTIIDIQNWTKKDIEDNVENDPTAYLVETILRVRDNGADLDKKVDLAKEMTETMKKYGYTDETLMSNVIEYALYENIHEAQKEWTARQWLNSMSLEYFTNQVSEKTKGYVYSGVTLKTDSGLMKDIFADNVDKINFKSLELPSNVVLIGVENKSIGNYDVNFQLNFTVDGVNWVAYIGNRNDQYVVLDIDKFVKNTNDSNTNSNSGTDNKVENNVNPNPIIEKDNAGNVQNNNASKPSNAGGATHVTEYPTVNDNVTGPDPSLTKPVDDPNTNGGGVVITDPSNFFSGSTDSEERKQELRDQGLILPGDPGYDDTPVGY